MRISKSSLLYELAFFPRLQWLRERKLGRELLLPIIELSNIKKHLNHFTEDVESRWEDAVRRSLPEYISLCSFFWRVVLSPLSISLTLLGAIWAFGIVVGIVVGLPVMAIWFTYLILTKFLWPWAKTLPASIAELSNANAWGDTLYPLLIMAGSAIVIILLMKMKKTDVYTESKTLIRERYKAWKQKVCPILEITD